MGTVRHMRNGAENFDKLTTEFPDKLDQLQQEATEVIAHIKANSDLMTVAIVGAAIAIVLVCAAIYVGKKAE